MVFTVHNKELGTITITKDKRAKYFRIRLTLSGYKMTVPYQASINQIEKVIEDSVEKIKKKKWNFNKRTLITENHPLITPNLEVFVKKSKRENLYSQLNKYRLEIEYPEHRNVEENEIQRGIWKIVEHFFILKSKDTLPNMTKELAQKWGFKYEKVKIQRSKTRWGSCSSKGNINLSCYLMLTPQHLQKYVILHELCHTVEMNHSSKFKTLLNKVTENQRVSLEKELQKYSIPKF